MNMFMIMRWGFLIGSGSVGIPAFLLVITTDARTEGYSWLTALVAALVGGVWASLLALQKNSADLRRAARLGVYASLAIAFLVSPLILLYAFFYFPPLVVVVPLYALLGAGMGAAMGWILKQLAWNPRPTVGRFPSRRSNH
jgi:hypothetical protein